MKQLTTDLIEDIYSLEQLESKRYSSSLVVSLQEELLSIVNQRKVLLYKVINKLISKNDCIDTLIQETNILLLKDLSVGFISFIKKEQYQKISSILDGNANISFISHLKENKGNANNVILPRHISLYKSEIDLYLKSKQDNTNESNEILLNKANEVLDRWFLNFNQKNVKTIFGLNRLLYISVKNGIKTTDLTKIMEIIKTVNESKNENFIVLKYTLVECIKNLNKQELLDSCSFEKDKIKLLLVD